MRHVGRETKVSLKSLREKPVGAPLPSFVYILETERANPLNTLINALDLTGAYFHILIYVLLMKCI